MKIESLKDLQKVIQTCRKLGVQSIKIDNVEFHLGPLPTKTTTSAISNMDFPDIPTITPFTPGGITEQTKIIEESVKIATDELSEEQLLFYSSRPEDAAGAQ